MAFLAPLAGIAGGAAGGGISLGSIFGAVGSIISGMAAASAAAQQAKIAEANAAIAYQNSQRATDQSQQEAQKADTEIAAFIGEQEAAQSASGLKTTGKSQTLTRKAAARVGRIDTRNIYQAGRERATGFMQQQADFKGQAQQAKARGSMAMLSGFIGAGQSLIGGASPTRSRFV